MSKDAINREIREYSASNEVSHSRVGAKLYRALKETESDTNYRPVADRQILTVKIDLGLNKCSPIYQATQSDLDNQLLKTELRKIGNVYCAPKIKAPENIKAQQ